MSERLEEIKILEGALKYQDSETGEWFINIDYESFKYLREQAERLQELEEDKRIMQLNLTKFVKDIKRLKKQNKHYYTSLKEANSIIFEAKESLDKGEKVNGLGYLYMAINQALESESE